VIDRWERGRAEVDDLLQRGRLTRVAANRELAERNVATARTHLLASTAVRDLDPAGAFTLAYDAARLALAAFLVNQGLKPRGEGAHAVQLDVAIAQLEPPKQAEIRQFDWMRRLRNDTQYPDVGRPSASVDDADQAVVAARAILDRVEKLIDLMPAF
jgi:HEPN domain-containing protein